MELIENAHELHHITRGKQDVECYSWRSGKSCSRFVRSLQLVHLFKNTASESKAKSPQNIWDVSCSEDWSETRCVSCNPRNCNNQKRHQMSSPLLSFVCILLLCQVCKSLSSDSDDMVHKRRRLDVDEPVAAALLPPPLLRTVQVSTSEDGAPVVLGQGMKGAIYEGIVVETGEQVALKHPLAVDDERLPGWIEEFMSEANANIRLFQELSNSPFYSLFVGFRGIVYNSPPSPLPNKLVLPTELLSLEQVSDMQDLVFEVCRGGSFQDFAADHRDNFEDYSPQMQREITNTLFTHLHTIFKAYAVAADHGVVSKDFHNGQPLLCPSETGQVVKLADFGESLVMEEMSPSLEIPFIHMAAVLLESLFELGDEILLEVEATDYTKFKDEMSLDNVIQLSPRIVESLLQLSFQAKLGTLPAEFVFVFPLLVNSLLEDQDAATISEAPQRAHLNTQTLQITLDTDLGTDFNKLVEQVEASSWIAVLSSSRHSQVLVEFISEERVDEFLSVLVQAYELYSQVGEYILMTIGVFVTSEQDPALKFKPLIGLSLAADELICAMVSIVQ